MTLLAHGGRQLEHKGSSLLPLSAASSTARTDCPLPCATSQCSALSTHQDDS